jgi:hypothetical protein
VRRVAAAAALLTVGLAPAALGSNTPPPREGGSGAATISDPYLNVTWLADADLAATQKFGLKIARDGAMSYPTAVRWVKRLNAYDHGKGWLDHDDWTLPVTPTPLSDSSCQSYNGSGGGSFGYGCLKSPFGSLYSRTFGLDAPDTAVPVGDTQTAPFHDFQPYLYWTDTQTPRNPDGYATFSFDTGRPGSNISKHSMYVLPMIPGNPFGTAAGSPLDPSADGTTVYEPDAGVTWLADADLARTQPFDTAGIDADGSMEQDTAVTWASRMNGWVEHGKGKNGFWRLPTPVELGKLWAALQVPAGEPVVPTPRVTLAGFDDVQPYLYWSCAGAGVDGPCAGAPKSGMQWSFSLGNGFQGTDLTGNRLYVEVYYPNASPSPTPGHGKTPCGTQQPGKPITCQ